VNKAPEEGTFAIEVRSPVEALISVSPAVVTVASLTDVHVPVFGQHCAPVAGATDRAHRARRRAHQRRGQGAGRFVSSPRPVCADAGLRSLSS
jgi:hypothetical protein